jgi:transposase-like protein
MSSFDLERAKENWKKLTKRKRALNDRLTAIVSDFDCDDDDCDVKTKTKKRLMKVTTTAAAEEGEEDKKEEDKEEEKTAVMKVKNYQKIKNKSLTICGTLELCELWEKRILRVNKDDFDFNDFRDDDDDDDDFEEKYAAMEFENDLKESNAQILHLLQEGLEAIESYFDKIIGKVTSKKLIEFSKKFRIQITKLAAQDKQQKVIGTIATKNKNKNENKKKDRAITIVDAFNLYVQCESFLDRNQKKLTNLKTQPLIPCPRGCENERFKTQFLLDQHIASKHNSGIKTIACNHCGGTFSNNAGLQRHINMHHSQKYTCNDCNPQRRFQSGYDLKMHNKRFHSEEAKMKKQLKVRDPKVVRRQKKMEKAANEFYGSVNNFLLD